MAHCPGCDSEIAENTVFCPYCGINLRQNAAAAENGGDDDLRETEDNPVLLENKSFEGEINNNLPESNAGENETPENQSDSTTQAPKEIYANNNVFAAQTAKESETESSEVAENLNSFVNESALIQERKDDTGEDIEKAKYENFVIERESNRNDSETWATEEFVFVPGENEKIHPSSESQTESEMMSYEEVAVKESPTAENSLEQSITEAEQDSSGDVPESENAKAASDENKAVENLTAQNSPNVETNVEQPISKPEMELEPAEGNCPPPRFDSVRIMEKPASINKENSFGDNAGNLQSAKTPKKESPLETQISHSTQNKQADARSFTAPNIAFTETDGKKSAKLKQLEEGTVLNGRYEIVRKIGGGGMGAVYLASDKNLGGVLRAVKEMVQSYIEDAQQEKAINDFKRESLLLTSLEHQSIPTIYDYFFDEKEARFYLVMKYISGGDLSSRLRSAPENRIEEKIVTEWAIQIADVLYYLHNRQPAIIYRDLKPSNIMIDGNSNRVMLIDFGIARWVNKEEKGVTAVGTMGYAPPELFSGNVEPRSDIYSLGSTLFHLLTGADPQSNPLLIFDFQKHPRPRQINPQISDQMEKILMRAVEYNADSRFASAAELRDALAKHLDNLRANRVTFGVKETPSPAAFADQPVFCGFCGQKIVATDMFCAFCGAKQPLAQKGVHLHGYSPERFTAQLLVVGTNDLEAPMFRLEKDENLVGRRDPMSNIFPEIDLSKFDPQTKISRKHARIWREGTSFLVEDLGSSNGTIVLPVVKETVRLLPHQPFALNNGDKIKLGDTTLHFVLA